ncbi:hypothetical protein PsorP6_000985 [Peronosclerospora sorghi]|uniref:Uncharacterized protein n=1 Tax=Peronosclerospora sorghi TaxID=230839 RepID=A0ACC0WRW6_9STRA|nr:hypothetical protein PsorP6_000985 [Peronosclerospora sorghi]
MTKLGIAALTRGVSSGPKRAKPIRIKKSEATRVVPTASTAPSNDALTEAPTPLPPASHLAHSSHEAPHTFGEFFVGYGHGGCFRDGWDHFQQPRTSRFSADHEISLVKKKLLLTLGCPVVCQSTSAHVFERSVVKAAEKEHEEGR